jgi:hypothetical protein
VLTLVLTQRLYNAMTSTGAGGAQSPYLVLRATSVLSCMMIGAFFTLLSFSASERIPPAVSCYTGSLWANKLGLKWTLVLGTTGYALVSLSAALPQHGRHWLCPFFEALSDVRCSSLCISSIRVGFI